MVSSLPTRLRASAQEMRGLNPAIRRVGFFRVHAGRAIDDLVADRIARELEEAAQALEIARGVVSLDPIPHTEAFDGITGRPFGVATDQPDQGKKHG